MTLRHLKIFLLVADEEKISAAADKLYISQPSVSQAIIELEKYYGIKLFDRIGKRLYITESGKKLESYARHITSLFDEMERNIKFSESSGSIRIGASLTIGAAILPGLIVKFNENFKEIRTELVVKNTSDIEHLILKNNIDLALVEGQVHSPDLVMKPFMDDEIVLICGPRYPLSHLSPVTRMQLNNEKFIVREKGSGTRELFESHMELNNIKWQQQWECAGPDGIISAALANLGIGVISGLLVQKYLQDGSLRKINVSGLVFSRKFSIIHHKNKYLSAALKSFMELCENNPGYK